MGISMYSCPHRLGSAWRAVSSTKSGGNPTIHQPWPVIWARVNGEYLEKDDLGRLSGSNPDIVHGLDPIRKRSYLMILVGKLNKQLSNFSDTSINVPFGNIVYEYLSWVTELPQPLTQVTNRQSAIHQALLTTSITTQYFPRST